MKFRYYLLKKSQISIFIIIGLIMIVSAIFLLKSSNLSFFNSDKGEINQKVSLDKNIQVKNINFYLQNCIDDSMDKTFLELGLNGMYSVENYSSKYYIYNSKTQVPEILDIELEFSKELNKNVLFCVNDIKSSLVENGYNVKIGNISSITIITNSSIQSNVLLPFSVDKNLDSLSFEKFSTKIDYNFIEKYQLVKEFINLQEKDLNYLSLTGISNLAYKNNFTYQTMYIKTNIVEFTFRFDDYKKERPFEYSFLVEYNWSDIE